MTISNINKKANIKKANFKRVTCHLLFILTFQIRQSVTGILTTLRENGKMIRQKSVNIIRVHKSLLGINICTTPCFNFFDGLVQFSTLYLHQIHFRSNSFANNDAKL